MSTQPTREPMKPEDTYNPDLIIMGLATILAWTLFLPLTLLAWIGKRHNR